MTNDSEHLDLLLSAFPFLDKLTTDQLLALATAMDNAKLQKAVELKVLNAPAWSGFASAKFAEYLKRERAEQTAL